MGVPPALVHQWYLSLKNVCRVWRLGQECTGVLPTNHGVPEGDAWSVVAILSLAYVWSLDIRRHAPRAFLSAYADNWSWAATNTEDHTAILRNTTAFVRLVDMVVDWPKCWAWATGPDQFAALKTVLNNHEPTRCLQRRLNAMDLGAQLTYQGSPQLGKYKKRLEKAHMRLLRLQQIKLPLPVKTQLVKGSIYPVALYGTEVIPLGETHIKKLRTAISNALLGPSQTRNPALAIMAVNHLVDPQLELLLRMLRSMKRLACSLDEETRTLVFKMAAQHSGLSYRCRGPAGVLAYTLSKIGWSFTSQGCVQVGPGLALPLITTSATVFQRFAMQAWDQDVMLHQSDRKKLRMLRLNTPDTRQVLATFTEGEQLQLAQELSLGFQTESQKQKWADDTDGRCQHCDQLDSRFHRLFECAAAQEVRQPYDATLNHCLTQGLEFHDLPFLLQHPSYELVQQLHYCQPPPMLDEAMQNQLKNLDSLGFATCFYTDGSLRFPQSHTCRFGAFAIIIDTCVSDNQRVAQAELWRRTGTFPVSLGRLAMARLQGPQTIHRAELMAVVSVCEWCSRAIIKTDSASVTHAFLLCKMAHQFTDIQHLEDPDLLYRLWLALRRGSQTVVKVKAHQEPTLAHTALEVYDILGNRQADEMAVATCKSFQPEVAQLCQDMYMDVQCDKLYLRSFLAYLLDLRRHFALLQADKTELTVHADLRANTAPEPRDILANWQVPYPRAAYDVGVTFLQYSAWGRPFADMVLQWMRQVEWPDTEEVDEKDPGISWIELVTSFVLWSKIMPPLKRKDLAGTDFLQCIDSWEQVTVHNIGLGEQANNFAIIVNQIRGLVTRDPWPARPRGFCRCLFLLGARNHPYGFRQRPVIPCQQGVVNYLYKYLRRFEKYDTFPEVEDCQLITLDRAHLGGSWTQALKQVAKGYAMVKTWRRQPQRGLSF